ncbi:MAG: acyl carrier protein, partial [Thermoanaerobaculia bacterium]
GEPAGEDVAAHVREVITGAMCEELRIEAAVINPNASLADYGVDSIVGVNLVSRISESLKVPLEASSLFEYSSVNRLASYIVANWKQQIARAAAPADVGSEVSAEAGANVELAALPEGSACVEMLPVLRDSEGEIDDNEILEQVLWQDTSVDDSYEKVTF